MTEWNFLGRSLSEWLLSNEELFVNELEGACGRIPYGQRTQYVQQQKRLSEIRNKRADGSHAKIAR